MSARAWILFAYLTVTVTGAAWAVTPQRGPGEPRDRAHARVAVDLETNSCRVLWVEN